MLQRVQTLLPRTSKIIHTEKRDTDNEDLIPIIFSGKFIPIIMKKLRDTYLEKKCVNKESSNLSPNMPKNLTTHCKPPLLFLFSFLFFCHESVD